jgi:transketolase
MLHAKLKGLTSRELDELAINTIRTLSIDAVQQARSGHPGTPMALAPLVYVIWNEVMRFDPHDPIWPNRDRFVLSNGHASMLLWSVLYLTGTRAVNAQYERLGERAVTLDDIRHFRQLGSKAPGHPEYHLVSGVEATTGPLGQGIANSVGMAIARKWLASRYNKPGFDLFDYDIYAVCGDGCLMEGVGSEAASLAGHLALDDLCWIYDNNHITIDGNTRITFTEDVAARFLAYHWNVLRVGDANDLESIEEAVAVFRKTKDRPTLIILDSHIGYGSPHKVDTSAAHGEPLGEDEVRLVKRAYHWPENADFLVPEGVREHFAEGIGKRGGKARRDWESMFAKYRDRFPDLATEIDQMQRRELPAGWDRNLPSFAPDANGIAGRDASGPQRARPEYSMVARRLGRSRIINQDSTRIPRRRGIRTRHARWPQSAFWHSRARDGGDRQRPVAFEAARLRIDVPHLQRLRPTGHSALRAHGATDHFRFHA